MSDVIAAPSVQMSWKPSKRNCVFPEKPDWVPEDLYLIAKAAKNNYNVEWEFWVWRTSIDHNCSMALAEDACIRGIKKEINRMYHVYGPSLGKWFEDYLDMGDIFRKVKHPEYVAELGYRLGAPT